MKTISRDSLRSHYVVCMNWVYAKDVPIWFLLDCLIKANYEQDCHINLSLKYITTIV